MKKNLFSILAITMIVFGLMLSLGLCDDSQKPADVKESVLKQPKISDGKGKVVYLITIEGMIDKGLPFYINRAIASAEKANVDALIIEINTLGGEVDAALLIRDKLINSNIKSYALIHRAISAGALISLSCDEMYMLPGATIGASLPVTLAPTATGTTAADQKHIDYLRAEFRATAEKKGHPIDLAEAMVDPAIEIKGVKTKGNLLTLTAEESVKNKLIKDMANSKDDFLQKVGLQKAKIITPTLSNAEKVARALSNPNFSWVLLMLGMLALIAEFKAPNGFVGTTGLILLCLFFWGSYIAELAGWFEIILFLLGIGLLALEIFVIPGFGVTGVAGIFLILVSMFFAMIKVPESGAGPGWDFLNVPLRNMSIIMVMLTVAIVYILNHLPNSKMWGRISLKKQLSGKDGFVSSASDTNSDLLGMSGVTITIMRPTGIVEIGDKRINAITDGDFLQPSTKIKVINVSGGQVVVEEINEN